MLLSEDSVDSSPNTPLSQSSHHLHLQYLLNHMFRHCHLAAGASHRATRTNQSRRKGGRRQRRRPQKEKGSGFSRDRVSLSGDSPLPCCPSNSLTSPSVLLPPPQPLPHRLPARGNASSPPHVMPASSLASPSSSSSTVSSTPRPPPAPPADAAQGGRHRRGRGPHARPHG